MKIKRLSRRVSVYGNALYSRSRLPRLNSWLYSLGKADSVFIWIPKNAGQTISRHVSHTCGLQKRKTIESIRTHFVAKGPFTFGHISVADLMSESFIDRRFIESAFVYAFSRNPYTRFASLYCHHKKHKIIPQETTIRDFVRLVSSPHLTPIGLYNGKSLSMCNLQVRWLRDVRVDYLGSVENLASDLPKLIQRLCGQQSACDGAKNCNETHSSNSRHVLSDFSDDIVGFVRDFYAEDFERFDYSTDFEERNNLPGSRRIPEIVPSTLPK